MQLCGPRAWVRKGCFISEIGERFFWGMTRYARYAGTQILMCFGDISCYDDFLYTPIHHVYNCIIYIYDMHTMHTWNMDWFTYYCIITIFTAGANGSLGSGRKGRFASGQWQGAGPIKEGKTWWSNVTGKPILSAFEQKQMREFVEDWNTANPWTIINFYGRQESKSKRFSGILKVPLKERLRPRFARVPPSFLMFPRTCCRGAMEDIQYT